MSVWFTLQLEDAPGSLARMASAIAARGVNITGIVGVAEDGDGSLMITTSDAAATREALTELGVAFEQHASPSGVDAPLAGATPDGAPDARGWPGTAGGAS